MRISVFGCGYLGTVHAASMAEFGHDVIAIDVEEQRVRDLANGLPPFFEPGLAELLVSGGASGRLQFELSAEAARGCTVHFICVGTPQLNETGQSDLRQVEAALQAILTIVAPGDVVVGKSTVPVGTAEVLSKTLLAHEPGATLVWNPEFLREGRAIGDSMSPDRLVYGHVDNEAGRRAAKVLDDVYVQAIASGTPRFAMDLATAQLVKVAANSFLATKVSFINAMAELCEATGADVTVLADSIGVDPRIGRSYLNAGIGFGGGCLPKDIRAFMARADELGVDQALTFLREVDAINSRRRHRTVDLARELCAGSLRDRKVAVLGAAFKPDSDDVRESPAMDIASLLAHGGAAVTITDPRAIENARRKWPELRFAPSVREACDDVDLVLLLTEWPEYVALDPRNLKSVVAIPQVVDGRNCLNPVVWRAAGWTYRALGRP